jgi:ribosomal protein L35
MAKKLKVSKTVKKRFKTTKKGKLVHARGGVKHRKSKETSKLKTRGKRSKTLKGPEEKKMRKILGIGKRKR